MFVCPNDTSSTLVILKNIIKNIDNGALTSKPSALRGRPWEYDEIFALDNL
jgi:hypothetical protein